MKHLCEMTLSQRNATAVPIISPYLTNLNCNYIIISAYHIFTYLGESEIKVLKLFSQNILEIQKSIERSLPFTWFWSHGKSTQPPVKKFIFKSHFLIQLIFLGGGHLHLNILLDLYSGDKNRDHKELSKYRTY